MKGNFMFDVKPKYHYDHGTVTKFTSTLTRQSVKGLSTFLIYSWVFLDFLHICAFLPSSPPESTIFRSNVIVSYPVPLPLLPVVPSNECHRGCPLRKHFRHSPLFDSMKTDSSSLYQDLRGWAKPIVIFLGKDGSRKVDSDTGEAVLDLSPQHPYLQGRSLRSTCWMALGGWVK